MESHEASVINAIEQSGGDKRLGPHSARARLALATRVSTSARRGIEVRVANLPAQGESAAVVRHSSSVAVMTARGPNAGTLCGIGQDRKEGRVELAWMFVLWVPSIGSSSGIFD